MDLIAISLRRALDILILFNYQWLTFECFPCYHQQLILRWFMLLVAYPGGSPLDTGYHWWLTPAYLLDRPVPIEIIVIAKISSHTLTQRITIWQETQIAAPVPIC